MLKRRFPEPEASGGSAKRARQLDRDRESLQQQGHRVARSQVEGIPRAWRLQIIDRERLSATDRSARRSCCASFRRWNFSRPPLPVSLCMCIHNKGWWDAARVRLQTAPVSAYAVRGVCA